MSTTSSSTPVDTLATNSTLRPMKTAFLQPPGCTGQFSTTSYLYYNSTKYDYTHITLAVSDTLNPQFTTCQPPGWATVIPHNRLIFSPGVCPQEWTAYHLEATTARYETTVSSAYCCSSGFTLSFDYPYQTTSASLLYRINSDGLPYTVYPGPISDYPGPGCYRQVPETPGAVTSTATPTPTNAFTTTPTPTVSLQMHLPYSIQWQASDTNHMSPRPPPVPCTYSLYSWMPSQSLATSDETYAWGGRGSVYVPPTGTGTNYRDGTFVPTSSNAPVNTDCPLVEGVGKGIDRGYAALIGFGTIGVPILVIALASFCCFMCLRGRYKNKDDARRTAEIVQQRRADVAWERQQYEQEQYEQAVAISLREMPPPTAGVAATTTTGAATDAVETK